MTSGVTKYPARFNCTACGTWMGTEHEIDRVPDPKPGSDMIWNVCPHCRAAEQFYSICDEPGCDKTAGCGWPSDEGYRRTCFDHSPWAKSNETASKQT